MMSRHKTKRVLAIILALMLVLGALPVYAAEADPIEVTFVSEQHEMDSLMGSEGDNQQYSPTPQMPERASVSRHIDGGTNITRDGEISIVGFSTPAPVAYAHDEDSLWNAIDEVFWYWWDNGITVPRIIYLQDDIELSDWGSLLISAGTDITLRSYGDVMHTLSIDTYWWYRVGVVFVEAGAYLTLDGIRVADGGGKVYFGGGVMNWGNLTMISGEISGNTALVSGGGVANMGTFTMYGGIITGNNVTGDNTAGDGGGVANWGTFIMGSESDPSLNPQITYNTAQPWNGGGVFNMNTFTMHSGVISGNEAGNNGGGVMNWDGTVIMHGGTITGNSATHGGGVRNNGTFTLNNGTISNNTITNWGAGVDNAGTFVMWNGTITNNESTVWSGGGVANRASFTMHNGTISNNTAPSNGGGVHSPGAFTIHGGTISGNTAPWGGGVWSDSTFNMTGGYIINNYGTYRGVLFGANISSMTMSGGIVFGGLLGRWVPRTGTALVWDSTTTEFVEGTSTELSTAPDNTAVWGIQGGQYGIVFNGTFIHVPGVSVWSTGTPPTFTFGTQQGVALAGTSSTVSFLITGPASTSMDIRGPIPPGIAFRGYTHFGQEMILVDIAATVPAGTYHFIINFSVPGHPLIPSNGIDVVVSESHTAPSVPQNFTATAGNRQVVLSWTVPDSDGGSPITGYEVSSDDGTTWVTASTDTGHTFTGLTNGTAYTFRVRAVNSIGSGAEATVTATPRSVGGTGGGWRPPTTAVTPEQVPLADYEPKADELQFPFIDVAATDWFYAYVRTVWENQLFQGTSHNMFTPQGNMTRAMFVQVLANMEGVDLTAYETVPPTFADTSQAAWYFAAVEWAAEQGLVQGVGNDNFAPGRAITREEMAVMLHNYAVSRDISLSQGTAQTFADQDNISSWAVDGVLAIQAAGIIMGRPDGRFAPRDTATRAEVAAIFARFLEVTGVIE